MNNINNRNDWIFSKCGNILEDKDAMLRSLVLQMLNKTIKIFKYTNLPDTIKAKDLETQIQVGGFAVWKKVDGKLYTFNAGLGGEPNPYYLPTLAIIANPALKYNASLKIDKECVVMLNDYFYQGMMPLFNKYGNLLVEAELSLKYAIINARVPSLVQADNDSTYLSAVEFFKKIVDGKDYGVIASKEFFDGIRTQDFYKQPYIKDLIEAIQYIKGSWSLEIGLNSTFNMKRESINESEAELNEDVLFPTIDAMLDCRKKAIERVNEMYGTDIRVELDSVWKTNQEQQLLEIENKKAVIASLEGDKDDSK